MGIFDGIINIDKNGNVVYRIWVEWKHIQTGMTHCPVCLSLDKCWFDESKMPTIPQHQRCHCIKKYIPIPKPQIDSKAYCSISKFEDYIFSDKYAWTGKRVLFEKLGFQKSDSEYLKKEFEMQANKEYCNGNYRLGRLNEQGQRIDIDVRIEKNGRQIVFTSGWMVRAKGLITNNTPLAK